MLAPPALQLLENLINVTLAEQGASLKQYRDLEGLSIAIEIQNDLLHTFEFLKEFAKFQCYFSPKGMVLSGDSRAEADIKISGNPKQIAYWVLGSNQSGIVFSGDIAQLTQCQQWLQSLEIDWSSFISTIAGENASSVVHFFSSKLKHFFS